MDSSVSPKDETWFLRVCHHISTGIYQIRSKRSGGKKEASTCRESNPSTSVVKKIITLSYPGTALL